MPIKIPPTVAFQLFIAPTIKAKINAMMKTIMMNARSFTIPTLEMSPLASPMDRAYPKSSVLANLHWPINAAKAKIIINMAVNKPDNQCWKIIAKIDPIIIGMRK